MTTPGLWSKVDWDLSVKARYLVMKWVLWFHHTLLGSAWTWLLGGNPPEPCRKCHQMDGIYPYICWNNKTSESSSPCPVCSPCSRLLCFLCMKSLQLLWCSLCKSLTCFTGPFDVALVQHQLCCASSEIHFHTPPQTVFSFQIALPHTASLIRVLLPCLPEEPPGKPHTELLTTTSGPEGEKQEKSLVS